ncbi:short-chain collagen C4-like isoform X2 [Mizuhopecten yessoensis]|uniref:short-chain collagen C4-like isoform X2 n=1 Tax=Mizuhopecten yessoensis TaxID=6573 RepID=UPI000B45AAC7|nr:short-chain collagen C4-like isoform X2 [Mizuhopecten yessoensis]
MSFSCLKIAFFLTVISYSNGSDEKRILLSDPQYIQQEMTRFQSELQEMRVKYNDLQAKYDAQNTDLLSIQAKNDAQNTDLLSLQTTVTGLPGGRGAVFTRWGRNDCPANTTTMVYSGYAGGSYFTHPGAAAEYVCMPTDPIWGPYKDYVYGNENVGYIYGAEYEEPAHIFSMPNSAEDVPCSVCLGSSHSASLMIPGRTQCYPGWTEAYHGELASGYHGHAAASQYVCVDQDPQTLPAGGTHDENGKLFYGVKAKCGSLPCPPYEDGKFLSCVVCMK